MNHLGTSGAQVVLVLPPLHHHHNLLLRSLPYLGKSVGARTSAPWAGRSAAAWFICATQKNLALTQHLLTQQLRPVGLAR